MDADSWTHGEEYADAVDQRWRALLLVGVAFELLIGLVNLLRLPAPANVIVAGAQATAGLALLVAWWLLRGRSLRHRQSQPVIAIVLLVLAAIVPLEMALTGNGLLTANVGLILVVSGALVVSTRWFAIAGGTLVVAWLAVLLTRGPWDQPVDALLLYVLVAGMSATLVHILRVHSRARLVAALDEARTNALRHDVTGLWNRRGARIAARPLLGQARRDHDPVWAVVMDVDGIADIERHLGGPAADRLLAAVGRAVARCEDDGYVAASWSASRFVLFGEGPLPEVDDLVTRLAVRARATGGVVDRAWALDPGVALVSDLSGDDVVDRLVAAAVAERSARRLAADADTGRAA